MQNPMIGSKNPAKSLHNATDAVRDTAEQVTSDISSKASRVAERTRENANEFYDRASIWIQHNYGKTLGVVGALAAVGTIGYLLGRNNQHSEPEVRSQSQSY